ncbi:MAG: glutamate-5-semialdehyde dehydrogenase [Bacteroidales bacterium]|jgi:glutamate-5-semialdehyde dehydrogenase|nr:glutamate-5-semialdehyde dehydrogenase [Bacteroidales bacterium]
MDITPVLKKAVKAGKTLLETDNKVIDKLLLDLADETVSKSDYIIAENRKDLDLMDRSDPKYDRLQLTGERIASIASDIRNVSGLPSPLGRILSESERPNGLVISKVSVPFGVIGIIYEARPNVTFDVFSLCVKSGNACILKGGSDAIHSNKAIVAIIKDVLDKNGFSRDIISLLPAGHEETAQLMNAHGYVDLIIPRGSSRLIDFVRKNSTIPVIETGAGVCHTFFDELGDREKGRRIIHNAKTRRVSVCNALDCLIIHEQRLSDLYYIVGLCKGSDVIIFADTKAYGALKGKYPPHLLKKASGDSFGTEFLSYKMAVKTVSSIDEALDHIEKYGSKHSEAIISEDPVNQRKFLSLVDASSVYSNTSTAFTDGAEFGLGAEIGISTQKLHARGPMALEEMTTYKWIICGSGQTRK